MSEHDPGSELRGSIASSQGAQSHTAAQAQHSGGATLAPKTSSVASLPEGWEQRINPKETIDFVNHNTKTTHWQLPDDEDAASLPEEWEVRFRKDGRRYYINHNTKSTSWTKPGPGVQHSLPEGWKVRGTKDGRIFYVNHTLKTTQWDPIEIRPSSEPRSTSQDAADAAPMSRPITIDGKLAVTASVKVHHFENLFIVRLWF